MTAGVSGVLFLAGVILVVLSALLPLRMRRPGDRLHLLAPMTTLGAPLVAIGLSLHLGWVPASAEVCVTCLLLAITGPVISTSAARVAAIREGTLPEEEPE